MHDTILGTLAAILALALVAAILARPLARLERALCAVAYGVHPTALTRNADGVLVVATATTTGVTR